MPSYSEQNSWVHASRSGGVVTRASSPSAYKDRHVAAKTCSTDLRIATCRSGWGDAGACEVGHIEHVHRPLTEGRDMRPR